MSNNKGHGHVVPRPDGLKARCGGPGLCPVCQTEQRLDAEFQEMLRKQAASAQMGMDAAKKAGAEMYRLGKQALDEAGRIAASTSFEELNSQRAANAMLTAQVEALEAERDALRAACIDAVMALAHASNRFPEYNAAYESVSAAIARKEQA
ncbi:hypothetical protein C7416_104457 [Cupriavidus phytorum]|uniref:Uncharacterized protein n=1 Tax=Cupriavidus phytorum TaxID=3024399 RepID=A0A2W7QUY1_9BURK|nr:hypothetical protein [Cupriavidus alkaliphilus]PZX29452.1 hypothetical protein C7416_104457 [Cupriavidus alkaliphilus]